MNGYRDGAHGEAHRGTHSIVRVTASDRRQVRVRKSSGRKPRDLPELDLRTPFGRLLPF